MYTDGISKRILIINRLKQYVAYYILTTLCENYSVMDDKSKSNVLFYIKFDKSLFYLLTTFVNYNIRILIWFYLYINENVLLDSLQ